MMDFFILLVLSLIAAALFEINDTLNKKRKDNGYDNRRY